MAETVRRIPSHPITAAVAEHGEGPIWDAAAGLVRWVDMPTGLVRSLDPTAGSPGLVPHADRVADFVSVVRPRAGGGWLACTRDSILLTDADFAVERSIPVPMGPEERFNDGGCAPDGTFYCGTMALDGTGKLIRLHLDGRVETVLTGITIGNGIGSTPDGSLMYYVDTATRRVDVFDVDEQGLHDRRVHIDLSEAEGGPDGLAVDASGGVWVAMWEGRCVRGYDAAGQLVAVIDVPTIKPTACAFVGEGLDLLAITSSTENVVPGSDALAGSLFLADPGVVGMLPLPFGG